MTLNITGSGGTPVKISTPFIKLDSFLKFCGAAETGGRAKEMISGGGITVNGEICLMRGKKLYPGAKVRIINEEMEYEVQ